MAANYKLTYFDFRGRGEMIRLLFVLGGKKFEDYRVQGGQWQKEQPNTHFGWLPVLTVDKKDYCDSFAIARYLASEFGFGGNSSKDRLEIDQVTGIIQDMIQLVIKYVYEKDKIKQAQVKKDVFESPSGLPRYLKALETILKENGQPFYVGKSVTLADIAAFDLMYERFEDSQFKDYPTVKANIQTVAGLDKIKEYIATRKPEAR